MENYDEKYLELMSRYKEQRLELGPDALPYLEAAMSLEEKGLVSEDAITAAAYL